MNQKDGEKEGSRDNLASRHKKKLKEQAVWSPIIVFPQREYKLQNVKQAILNILPKGIELGFRAISESELQSIKNTRALGSEPHKATSVQSETLYTTDLTIALSMFDGSVFGQGDTRHTGGYIVVFESQQESDSSTVSLFAPLPLTDILTFLKVDVISPNFSAELEEYENILRVSCLKMV